VAGEQVSAKGVAGLRTVTAGGKLVCRENMEAEFGLKQSCVEVVGCKVVVGNCQGRECMGMLVSRDNKDGKARAKVGFACWMARIMVADWWWAYTRLWSPHRMAESKNYLGEALGDNGMSRLWVEMSSSK
jgi:hypothetical protein